ncbi:hypothetical protein HNR45_000050 [Negativicoccus succinicivorans]|uniref:Uncharacterized protein n=1 Tax=Negativicoccus succinicivorans TaxID=620903 RepID=A0A841R2E1_9FIRM|nr:hypothetical protein [Negativicoccus succinicivorans]MBB6477028.1 hypothetical protein [Negativicoccus succinicivorans]
MKFHELEKILVDANVWPYNYAIGNLHKPLAEVAYCLIKDGQRYRFFITERDELVEEKFFNSENNACRYFLREFVKDDQNLQQYLDAKRLTAAP